MMDIQSIISAIEGWISVMVLCNIALTVLVVVFLVLVPKSLKDIAYYLRQIYLYGIGTNPTYKYKKDVVHDDGVNSQYWYDKKVLTNKHIFSIL